MITPRTNYIAGERIDDLVEALRGLRVSAARRGMSTIDGTVGPAAVRALMRVEAELLLADASGYPTDAIADRPYEQRRADAFALLIERLAATRLNGAKP